MRLLRSKLGDYEEEIRKKKNAALSADEWHSPFLPCLPTNRGFHVLCAKSKFPAAHCSFGIRAINESICLGGFFVIRRSRSIVGMINDKRPWPLIPGCR